MNASAGASANGQAFQNHRPPMIPIRNSGSGGKEQAASVPLNLGKKAKNVFSNGKRAEKRKISWHDQLALKAYVFLDSFGEGFIALVIVLVQWGEIILCRVVSCPVECLP